MNKNKIWEQQNRCLGDNYREYCAKTIFAINLDLRADITDNEVYDMKIAEFINEAKLKE